VAVGIAVLTAVVVAFQLLAWIGGMPGPGGAMVIGHLLAAALVLVVQRLADRWAGWRGAVTTLGVLAVTCATLWLFWWS
jgi:hypothetical protein